MPSRKSLESPIPAKQLVWSKPRRILPNRRQQGAQYIEGHRYFRVVAEQIDKARAEELKKNPRSADELGLSAEDVAAAKNVDADGVKAEAKAVDAYADVDGLEPVTKEWMNKAPPQVRQFLDQTATETEAVKQQFNEAVGHAHVWGQAAVVAIAPELAEHSAGALG